MNSNWYENCCIIKCYAVVCKFRNSVLRLSARLDRQFICIDKSNHYKLSWESQTVAWKRAVNNHNNHTISIQRIHSATFDAIAIYLFGRKIINDHSTFNRRERTNRLASGWPLPTVSNCHSLSGNPPVLDNQSNSILQCMYVYVCIIVLYMYYYITILSA